MAWAHLHVHSEFSLRDATTKPDQIAKVVAMYGQPAFALTDHGTCSGLMTAHKAAQKEGVKFIPGCEHYWTPEVTIKERGLKHILFLAKNRTGFENLMRLTTEAHQNFYYKPRLDNNIIRKYADGLICTTACLGGVLDEWKALREIFGPDLYVEIHTNQMPEQKAFNQKALALARKEGVKFFPATDTHYLRKLDARIHRLWVGVDDENDERYTTDDYYLYNEYEVKDALQYLGPDVADEGFATIDEILAKCDVDLEVKGQNYPVFPCADPKAEIKKKVWAGCVAKGHHADQRHIDQLRHELDILEKVNYLNYFLIVDSVIDRCRQNNIRVGIGRGSVVGCDVSYMMGFTGIDPLEYDLVFERFCHEHRSAAPDIDIDVPKSRRGEVIDFIRQQYGDVQQVRTFNYMADKAALKRAAQALKVSHEAAEELSKNIETLDDLTPEMPEEWGKRWKVWDFEYHDLISTAKAFKGILQNFGVHASAIVIFPKAPEYWCAIERGRDGYAANFDYHQLEECGLLKLDILGLATLDVIDNTLKYAGTNIDLGNLPPDDEATFRILNQGYTGGVFQLESDGMTGLIKQIRPKNVKELVPVVALYRPGILRSGMLQQFVASKKGRVNGKGLHPKINHILAETYGVIVYQEQIIRIVTELFGLTLGEADMVRRAIGRKEKEVLDAEIEKLKKIGIAKGLMPFDTDAILRIIAGFAEYGFNKSHAAAYAYTAYQTGYLKANFTVPFMCALLNNEIGDTEKTQQYINEARQMQIEVLPPSIYHSDLEWRMEDGKLRMGLKAIKGVGEFEFHRPDPHTGFENFMRLNPKINKRIVEALVKAGCFRESRQWCLDYAEWYKKDYSRRKEIEEKVAHYKAEGKEKFAETWAAKEKELSNSPSMVDTTDTDIIRMENEVLGFTFQDPLKNFVVDLAIAKPLQFVAGTVIKFKPHKTRRGDPMSFVTVRTVKDGQKDFVMFNNKTLDVGKVYLLRVRNQNVITEVKEARAKMPVAS